MNDIITMYLLIKFMTEGIIDSISDSVLDTDGRILFESFARGETVDVERIIDKKKAILINRLIQNHADEIKDIIDECNSMLKDDDIKKSRFEQWFTTKFNLMIESEKQKKISLVLSKDS